MKEINVICKSCGEATVISGDVEGRAKLCPYCKRTNLHSAIEGKVMEDQPSKKLTLNFINGELRVVDRTELDPRQLSTVVEQIYMDGFFNR